MEDSPTRKALGLGTVLSTIHEVDSELGITTFGQPERSTSAPPASELSVPELKRPSTLRNLFKQPQPINRSNTDSGFLTSTDLLNRLVSPLSLERLEKGLQRSNSVPPGQSPKQPTPSRSHSLRLKDMNALRRSERPDARRSPSLRASSLRSAATSSEHVIFGGEEQGKLIDRTSTPVLEAWGDRDGESKSPTRPPSIRRRQSLHILDLEDKLAKLSTEHTDLQEERTKLAEEVSKQKRKAGALDEALDNSKNLISKRDREIRELKQNVDFYQAEVARLSEENDKLVAKNTGLTETVNKNLASLNRKYDRKREQLIQLSKENTELQKQYSDLQTGMEKIVRHEIKAALQEKDVELERLRDELTKARGLVKKLQRDVAESAATDGNRYLSVKPEGYFLGACSNLLNSIQLWCSKFSGLSERKDCVSLHRLTDDWIRDRVESIILEDRGVRRLLKDRNRRHEVFTAIVMRIIRDSVFSRYLFGLDAEERQKLLSLEKTLEKSGRLKDSLMAIRTYLTRILCRTSWSRSSMARYYPHPPHTTTQLCRQEVRRF